MSLLHNESFPAHRAGLDSLIFSGSVFGKGVNMKWDNRVQWVRQRLIDKGDMSSPQRGIWAITEQGRQRVAENGGRASVEASPPPPPVSLVEVYETYEAQFRSKLLDKLFELTPTQFEHFANHLLREYGFVQMEVTKRSNDGGIDGHGQLKVGLARMAVAFQCKRWDGSIQRPEIDKFRGAIQGSFEQGIFFTTSEFTTGAKEVSIKKGAVPIVLLDGPSIVELMIEKGIGVQKRPLQIYDDQVEAIFGNDQ
jgi:restriction system protein